MVVTHVDGGNVEVERLFIGAGCNRVANNVSWGPSGLVAFGAQNAVAIFCPESAQILITLPGHKAVVNCTHWLPSSKDAHRATPKWTSHPTVWRRNNCRSAGCQR
ncbi:Elongator complex protein 2 [Platanthera guangdongensis]|uniref:Elongator complex protein 2 n=1 Tax=Platanthera guangdongensis TaxID=2320717 RepID=A0ABR2M2Z0_9ASPA